jgi:hypothetical protein
VASGDHAEEIGVLCPVEAHLVAGAEDLDPGARARDDIALDLIVVAPAASTPMSKPVTLPVLTTAWSANRIPEHWLPASARMVPTISRVMPEATDSPSHGQRVLSTGSDPPRRVSVTTTSPQ